MERDKNKEVPVALVMIGENYIQLKTLQYLNKQE